MFITLTLFSIISHFIFTEGCEETGENNFHNKLIPPTKKCRIFDDLVLESQHFANGSISLTDEEIAAYMTNFSSARGDDEQQYKRDLITYYMMGVGGMIVCCFGLIGKFVTLSRNHLARKRSSLFFCPELASHICDFLPGFATSSSTAFL